MILGTAGHIDHGKTTLVRALTGVDTDRLPEEKRRGITIDLGFAPLVIDGVGTIGIVDVPGHEAFVRTMLAGASGIDAALLVIAADEGIMPQTREHLEILSLLGIRKGIVVLSKCDLVDPEWLQLVRDEVAALVSSSVVNFSGIVAVSARTGSGMADLSACIERIFTGTAARSMHEDLFRLPVDRSFSIRGTGTVVTGTIWSGSIARDDLVMIYPGGKQSRVRAMRSHDVPIDFASAGMRTALALAGCEVADVPRGSVLVTDTGWVPTREFDAVLSLNKGFNPTARSRIRIHLGTSETGARFGAVRSTGDALHARVILDDPIVARGGDRFVVRMPSPARTVGGGRVVDPYPGGGKRARRAGGGLPPTGEVLSVARLVDEAGTEGADIRRIPVRTGLSPAEVAIALSRVGAIVSGERAVSSDALEALQADIEQFAARFMANHPLDPGVSLQTMRAALSAPGEVIDTALARLQNEQRVELLGAIVRPARWVSSLGDEEQALRADILHEICTGAAEPPSVAELTAAFGRNTQAMLRKLERDGEVERVSDDRFYGTEAVARMVSTLRSALEPARIYTPGELREVLGVSRKYLIPFLEFCDRKGVTERRQSGRTIRSVDS